VDERLAIEKASGLLRGAGEPCALEDYSTFLGFSDAAADAARDLSKAQKKALPWLMDWARVWRRLRDEFDRVVLADPMILYQPANRASLEFHSSRAFVRYFRAGNRTSKTQSGYAEHYFISTNQHKWRPFPYGAHASFIVGVNFSKYCPAVFEAKFLKGEEGNALSPMFPVGGKWFNHYDERRHVITIACTPCAETGKAGTCRHRKSTIRLFSDIEGWEVLQGASYLMGHFDEHIDELFFNEAIQRTQTAGPEACLVVTGTPLHGHEAWEHQRLTKLHLEGAPANQVDPGNEDSPPFVSLHEIDQFEAGLVPHDKIRMTMKVMDEFEVESRVYGRPAPLAKNPVFDRRVLAELRKDCLKAARGELSLPVGLHAAQTTEATLVTFDEGKSGDLRIWSPPNPSSQYILAVDTAKGLAGGDASCASVLEFYRSGISPRLRLVAQYHGWINPLDYAFEVFKLALYYNSALTAIELTGGYGEAVMLKMRQEFCYWNLFRDEASHSQAEHSLDGRFGVETNMRTKPFMVAALQQFVKDRAIGIPCEATITEMAAFEQERTKSGLSTRYRGVGGSHDDRVMSLVVGASVALTAQVLDYQVMMGDEPVSLTDQYSGDWLKIHRELGEGERVDPFDYV